jgi:hypothetical protein
VVSVKEGSFPYDGQIIASWPITCPATDKHWPVRPDNLHGRTVGTNGEQNSLGQDPIRLRPDVSSRSLGPTNQIPFEKSGSQRTFGENDLDEPRLERAHWRLMGISVDGEPAGSNTAAPTNVPGPPRRLAPHGRQPARFARARSA